MDPYEATKVVFSRIQSIDEENASKIMGLLLIQDNGEKEMIRLAFGPENLLHSLVVKSRQELGIISSNTPSSTTTITTTTTSSNNNNNDNFSRQNSNSSTRLFLPNNGVKIPTSLSIPTLVSPSPTSSPSWGGSVFNFSDFLSPCSSSNSGMNSNLGSVKSCSSTLNPSTPPFYCSSSRGGVGVGLGLGGGAEFIDEIQLQEQLSFLNDNSPSPTLRSKSSDFFYSQSELLGNGVGTGDSMALHGGASAHPHRRSCSVSDINLGSMLDDPSSGFGWKPCLYYAKGFCKNGSSCRFVHGELEATSLVGSPSKLEMMEQCHELMRSKSMQHQKLLAAIACGSASYPYKNLSLFAQHQQNDSPRSAAAMMMGEEMHKFSRSPRGLDSCRGDSGSVSRQIYLTFPADSTFREEDVSNYFRLTPAYI